MNRLTPAFALPILLILFGCVANTARRMSPIPSPSLLGRPAGTVVETADRWSFEQMEYRYPAGRGFHTIPVGRYLLDRIAAETVAVGSLGGVRVLEFVGEGALRGILSRHVATVRVVIEYRVGHAARKFDWSVSARDLGFFYSGDSQVAPLIGFTVTPDDLFHDQLRPLIDEIAREFASAVAKSA